MDIEQIAETLPKIRIVAVPKGEAPLHIREKWIGIEIPCLYFDKHGEDKIASLDYKNKVNSYISYCILQVHAIDVLRKRHPEAAQWWEEKGFPVNPSATFLFSADSVEPLGEILDRTSFYNLN